MKTELLIDSSTNAAQRYQTHGIFRFYGKYPPTTTRLVLNELWSRGAEGSVVDIMCGSGTTLLEALLAGREAIGIDVNPLGRLISRVKTEKAQPDLCRQLLASLNSSSSSLLDVEIDDSVNLFCNGVKGTVIDTDRIEQRRERVMSRVGHWFDAAQSLQHAFLATAISDLDASPEQRLLTLAWLKTIRRTSRASTRTGRLFLDKQKIAPKPFSLLAKLVDGIIAAQQSLPDECPRCDVLAGTAMVLSDTITDLGTAFWHPPYFALYKYSSDVMRLELEWMEVDRRAIAAKEIRDGFKTSNPDDVEKYLDDCRTVWQQLFAASRPGAWIAAVNSDSTLAKQRLNVIDRFTQQAIDVGFTVEQVFERPTQGTSAQYHRSSDPEIRTRVDYIIIAQRPN